MCCDTPNINTGWNPSIYILLVFLFFSQVLKNSSVCNTYNFFFILTFTLAVKFIYSEKATFFCEISTLDLYYVVTVKSMMEISKNFVAFSEYMNFNIYMRSLYVIHALNAFIWTSQNLPNTMRSKPLFYKITFKCPK